MGQANRLGRFLSASVAVFAATGVAHAQQAPAPAPAPAHSAGEDDSDDIIVLANSGDQVRIDRRTYTLRDDPVAHSTDMFDVLGRIPSVSVSPSGEITLSAPRASPSRSMARKYLAAVWSKYCVAFRVGVSSASK